MSHNPSHIIARGGSYVYNRRVPNAVVEQFGCRTVRVSLGKDRQEAETLSVALSGKLNELWSSPVVKPISVERLVDLVRPKATSLDDAVALYLHDRKDGKGQQFEKLAWFAHGVLVEVAGSKELESYNRSDARAFMSALWLCCTKGVDSSFEFNVVAMCNEQADAADVQDHELDLV